MTPAEYNQWQDNFASTFPEVGAWLAKQEPATLAIWRQTLADCNLAGALAATAQLHRDAIKVDGWSSYPGVVRKLARADTGAKSTYHPPRMRDGQETYTCVLCLDAAVATVTVLHPRTVRQLHGGRSWGECTSVTGRPSIDQCDVPCNCRRGIALAEMKDPKGRLLWGGPAAVYDPSRMFRTEQGVFSIRVEPDGLAEWLEQHRERGTRQMPAYDPSFDEWNEEAFS